ncbi:methyl-accepting chemotaxis protein [Paenibacillus aurantiacus]|uniref:Methyl-accepting chemotaxis protein n=1 Tax=Paenibacillus aurantiacus TaxID=1936118 RepID=A0ABV5KHP6_9BACL
MKLQGKLLTNALLSLLASLALVAYIIVQLLNMNAQNKDLVPAMLTIQDLKSEFIQTSQALGNFSFSMTDSNKTDVSTVLEATKATIKKLQTSIQDVEQQKLLATVAKKSEELSSAAEKAMNEKLSPEAKRQSLRTLGIQNDVYMLDLLAKAKYDQYTAELANNIRLTWQLALAGAVLLLVAVGAYNAWTARKLVRRIRSLNEAAQQMAQGNLAITVSPAKGRDEIEELSGAFQIMVRNIRGIIQSVEEAGERVEQMAKDIDDHNGNMKEVVSQVATSTEELAIGSQRIAEDVTTTVVLVDDMEHKFSSNLTMMHTSERRSEEAVEAIQQGGDMMDEQLRIVTGNREAMTAVERTVRELASSTEEISKMAGTVSDIAKQTTMLSLNASIEAARAGEAGKGFAVVAFEVKKLADQSTQAVKQIFSAVNAITASMGNVRSSVMESMEQFRVQEAAAEKTHEAFAHIREKVQQIAEQLGRMSGDMEASRRTCAEVQEAMTSISAITEQSAAGSEEITASTVTQQSAFEEAAGKVKALRSIAADMQSELRRFQL